MLNNWYDISVNFFLSMAYNIWIKLTASKKKFCVNICLKKVDELHWLRANCQVIRQ